MINSKKTLVACLDILGYKEIVENSAPTAVYDKGVAIFNDLNTLIIAAFPDKVTTQEEQVKQSSAEIMKAIRYHVLSDTIIVYLDCNHVEQINSKYSLEVDHDYSSMVMFLSAVATLNLLFIYHTGYLLRGGICLGEFYRNKFDTNLLNGDLIFSEAFVRSYLLESNAIYPRVLLDDKLFSIWKDKMDSSVNKDFVRSLVTLDNDGENYIDFYQILYHFDSATKRKWLKCISKQIKDMLEEKRDKKAEWRKWHWFKVYHNHKINSFIKDLDQDLNELII